MAVKMLHDMLTWACNPSTGGVKAGGALGL